MPETKRTLDQITQDTLSSNFGLSDADLALLFEDDTDNESDNSSDVTDASPSIETVQPVQPATTTPDVSTPVVNTVTPSPSPEPVKGVDISSLEDKVQQMSMIVQELMRKSQMPPQEAAPQQWVNPADEISDQDMIQKPKESTMKLLVGTLKAILPAAFAEYDASVQKRAFLEAFRQEHKDFDELRPMMRQIVAENPANDDVYALPRVYEEAKRRRTAAIEAFKKELAGTSAQPSASVPADLNEETLAKLEQRLAERIRKRRAVSGTLTSDQTAPVSPADRQTVTPKEKPMTAEEKMFLEMLQSGPASTRFLRGLDVTSRK